MAGHSKWKNNLHRKSAQDAKRSSNFAKLSRAITIAVIEGGSADPSFNPRLRIAIDNAKEGNMPKDNIERAIAKGSGPDRANLQGVVYEIFSPGGTALLAIATTDNANRTHNEVRSILERNGGKLGNTGSVSHMFTHCAVVYLPAGTLETTVLDIAEKLNAEDIENTDEHIAVYFPFNQLGKVGEILTAMSIKPLASSRSIYRPVVTVEVPDEHASTLAHLIELLDAHDDIFEVFTNGV